MQIPNPRFFFILILLAGALLRLADLGASGFTNIEPLVALGTVNGANIGYPYLLARLIYPVLALTGNLATPVTQMEWLVRLPIAILGLLILPLTYLLARQKFGARLSLLPMALVAFCPLLLANSRIATADVPLTFFILAAFYSLLRAEKDGRFWPLFGLAAGLAASTKISGLLLLPFLFVYLLFRHVKKERFATALFFLGLFLIPLTIFLINGPGTIEIYRTVEIGAKSVSYHRHLFAGELTSQQGFWYFLQMAPYKLQPALLALFAFGLLAALKKPDRFNLFLLAFCLLYFTAHSLMPVKEGMRYLLPMFPFLAVLSCNLASFVNRRLFLVLTLLAVGWAAYDAVSFHPYYLVYHSPLANPPEYYLSDCDLGWGNGIKPAAEYIAAQDPKKLYVSGELWGGLSLYLSPNLAREELIRGRRYFEKDPPYLCLNLADVCRDGDYLLLYLSDYQLWPCPIYKELEQYAPAFTAEEKGVWLSRVYNLKEICAQR